ncbi:MAG: orotate phosphoribosyltransferase [Paludibacteraceae bacterium]|nr:orotate phosphoribosyltransferase [Paludibacteraceae bacterium]
MSNIDQTIALRLLQLKAFSIQTKNLFTWGNGWKAPIYLDDRKILSYPPIRNFFRLELSRLVAEYFPDTDVIAGIATNAIAHGLLVAEQLALPFVSVYPFPKDHGLENQIEGDLRVRQRVVVVENQVNVGDHALRVIEALRNNGCSVEGIVTLFDYQFPVAKRRLDEVGVPLLSLTNFNALYQQLQSQQIYSPEVLTLLQQWHDNPSKWN